NRTGITNKAMSLSFKKIISKWSASEALQKQKIALSATKLHNVHIGVLLTLGAFFVVYLVQVNTLATKGYAIRELERNIVTQKKDNERLQLEIIEKQSMSTLHNKITALGLVDAGRIEYLIQTAAVATAMPPVAR
ncbi:MAG: hypothetical protein AAB855_04195, partial [Patescibacteria group bacterium]